MKGQYVIIDLRTMDFMKIEGKIIFFNTTEQALETCGIYEFEDVWVLQLIENYKEN